MSIVKNKPRYTISPLSAIRSTLEHRAEWLYLLCDEAEKKGLPWEDFARKAVHRCGLVQGSRLVEKYKGNQSLKGLKKTLFTLPAKLVFEMKELECTDDSLSLDFHFCPLVAAWQKLGVSDEKIAKLCDIAMDGDRGIAESFGCELQLGKKLSEGCDVCEIRFKRIKKE